MKRVLLGFALTAALAVPASAQSLETSGFSSLSAFGSSGSGELRTLSGRPAGHHGRFDRSHRRDHRGNGGFDGRHSRDHRSDDGFGAWGYYYDGDYDANRSFDPDKWNDWWHERPERAFPRWMSRNQDCARPWFSGDLLTC